MLLKSTIKPTGMMFPRSCEVETKYSESFLKMNDQHVADISIVNVCNSSMSNFYSRLQILSCISLRLILMFPRFVYYIIVVSY